jgi:two-component system, sensor histidine kinase and response regulator
VSEMKILVIEDEKDVRLNIIEILNSGGFDALNADNGKTGIKLAKEGAPDLIICDIKMSDFDGYNVLTELRQDPITATIPFIFLTAKAAKADIRQGMNLGADDYLTKPFRRFELLDTITARLKKHSALVQIQQKVQELQEITIRKNDLVSTITHDLRAPLATIKVALQLMETVPENRQQYLEIAAAACDQGDHLIQNLLDLYQLETDENPVVLQPLDLLETLRKITDLFEVRTRDCRQIFRVDIPSTLPVLVSDAVSLQRIFIELLNNACKYTPNHSEIVFQVRESFHPDLQQTIVFMLANQSEISAKDLPRIFDKFYRVTSNDRWQQSGTGLGLTLVKKLVEQIKGTIQVDSAQGWTTFRVDLPCKPLMTEY